MILGIDPGLTGAIALYRPSDGITGPPTLEVVDIPTLTLTVNKKRRKRLDMRRLTGFLRDNAWASTAQAVIEDVHALPKQGVVSSFTFGFVAGAIQAAIAARGIPFTLVQPYSWKRYFKLTADKAAARQRASELLPAFTRLWARKQDHGRAEAALLALYGCKALGLR